MAANDLRSTRSIMTRIGREIVDECAELQDEQADAIAQMAMSNASTGRGVHNYLARAVRVEDDGPEGATVEMDPRGITTSSGGRGMDVMWGAEYGSSRYAQFRQYRPRGYILDRAADEYVSSGRLDRERDAAFDRGLHRPR